MSGGVVDNSSEIFLRCNQWPVIVISNYMKSMALCLQKYISNHTSCGFCLWLCRGMRLLWGFEAALQEAGGQHLPRRPRGENVHLHPFTHSYRVYLQPSFPSQRAYLQLQLSFWQTLMFRNHLRESARKAPITRAGGQGSERKVSLFLLSWR